MEILLCLTPGDKKVTHLEFRREITLVLMKSSGRRIQSTCGRHANLSEDVRYDGQNHEPTACSQGRCVICQKNARSMCGKCNLRLHYSRAVIPNH